ncbi:ornithine carbamoyltransferase [soil metagenome]
MSKDLRGRSFLKEIDWRPDELEHVLDLAGQLKAARAAGRETQHLHGRRLALVFEKTSTRTRSAFEVAAFDQGAHVSTFDPTGSHLGHKESIADSARVLGRMYDAIAYRGERQADIEALAAHAGVPVYNALTADWHPTQLLADYMTMAETAARPMREVAYAFVGDLRFNMGRSHAVMAALMGADLRLVGPRELFPPPDVMALTQGIAARTGARITVTEDPVAGLAGVAFIHTDVWVSMGEPQAEVARRIALLRPYRVDARLMGLARDPEVRFMHCLPAFHDAATDVGRAMLEQAGLTDGLEVSDQVFQSAASIVFDQAENRLHTIKALLVATLGD